MRNLLPLFALAVCLLPFHSYAQLDTGRVAGRVTASHQAGIRITVTAEDKSDHRETVSDGSGAYIFCCLHPGVWTLSVSGVQASLAVSAGETTRADISINGAVAAIHSARAPESQSLIFLISPSEIASLPSLTRDPYTLLAILPDISPTDPSGLGFGYAVNGMRAASTNFLLDGWNNNDEFAAAVGQRIPQESVQEIGFAGSDFTAQYGHSSGAIVNVVSRTGGNAFHASLYEFNRVSALDSNTFLDNASSVAKGVYTRNQFGYSASGPVVRNKLFFFQNTEALVVRGDAPQFAMIPTPQFIAASAPATQAFFNRYGALRSGLQTVATFTKAQLNPCTRGAAATDPCVALPATTPTFSEVMYRAPSDVGGGAPENTYFVVGDADYILNDSTRLSARYNLYGESDLAGTVNSSPYAGYDAGQTAFDNRFTLSATRDWSPSLTATARASFNRLTNVQPLGANPAGPTLYMNAATTVQLAGQAVALPGYNAENPGAALPSGGPENMAGIATDVTKLWRAHDFRFGGEFNYVQDNRTFGSYQESAQGLGTTVGTAIDDFLTGQLHDFSAAIDPAGAYPGQSITLPAAPPSFSRSDRYRDSALYAQDTWRFNRRLTLNLGVRWEYFGVQHNSDAALDSDFYPGSGAITPQSIASGAVATVPNSAIKSLYKPDWRDFAPRVGFAYDIFGDGNTVFRGGYGIAYQRPFGNLTYNVIQNPPNYAVVSLTAGVDLPIIPIQTTNAGPFSSLSGTDILPATELRAIDPNLRTAYAHLFSATLERRITESTSASVSYSGSRGEHLYSISDVNAAGSANAYLSTPCTPGVFGNPGTCTARLDSQYSDIDLRSNGATSTYNAAIARVVTRNFWNTGITLDANYTFSHAIDNLSSAFSYPPLGDYQLGFLNAFAPSLDRGSSDFDIRHRVAVAAIWTIPFFRSRNLLGLRFLSDALRGWQLAPVFTARTGSPFTLYDCSNALEFCERAETAGPLPKRGVSNVPMSAPDSFLYYAFTTTLTSQAGVWYNPALGVSDFGPYPSNMLGRNTIYTRGNWNVDAGLYKNTAITDRLSLQLRLEIYNAFNHANFIVNTSDADVSSYAGVDGYFNGNRNLQLGARLTF